MGPENCTSYKPLERNSDTSGKGVMMAFLGTAYITFICCASKEIIDYKRLVPRAVPLLDKWSSALGGVVVGLSDQQIITGISIIIAGLTQLQRGIGAYQWQPVVNLAWFSAMTHLLKLTTLRNEVRSSMPLRLLRILGIGILILMLICALGPVGYITATEPPPQGFSAWCLYQLPLTWSKVSLQGTNSNHGLDKWDYNWVYVVFTAVLLIYSFCTNVILLSHNITISHHLLRVPRGQPCLLLEQMNLRIQDRRTQHSLYRVAQAACRTFLLSIYQTTHIFHDLYISKIWAITWLLFALVWGTLRIIYTRHSIGVDQFVSNADFERFQDGQKSWGFGQVMALGLLILPVISFFGAIFSYKTTIPDPALTEEKAYRVTSATTFFQSGGSHINEPTDAAPVRVKYAPTHATKSFSGSVIRNPS